MFSLGSSALLGAAAPPQSGNAARAATYHSIAPGTVQSAGGGDTAGGRAPERASREPEYDCTGVKPDDDREKDKKDKDPHYYLCDNWRLGPKDLSKTSVANLLEGYDRLGGEKTPKAFLDKY